MKFSLCLDRTRNTKDRVLWNNAVFDWITNDIQVKQITTKLSFIGNEVKIMANKLFNSSGKLRYGDEATDKFFEQQIGKITFL